MYSKCPDRDNPGFKLFSKFLITSTCCLTVMPHCTFLCKYCISCKILHFFLMLIKASTDWVNCGQPDCLPRKCALPGGCERMSSKTAVLQFYMRNLSGLSVNSLQPMGEQETVTCELFELQHEVNTASEIAQAAHSALTIQKTQESNGRTVSQQSPSVFPANPRGLHTDAPLQAGAPAWAQTVCLLDHMHLNPILQTDLCSVLNSK